MSSEKRLYQHSLRGLQKMQPTAHQGPTVTLALLMAGSILGKTAQLSKMSPKVPGASQDTSVAARMRRWVANPNVPYAVYFQPYAAALLAAPRPSP